MHEFDRCTIVDDHRSPVAEGFVRSFDDGAMEIMASADTSDWLRTSQPVRVYVYNASLGECIYEAQIQSAMMRHVFLKGLKLITNRQKRDNTRVNTDLAYLVRYYEDDNGVQQFEKPLSISILNVSAAGVYLSCKERFDIGFRFVLTFRETVRDIKLTAEVVRRIVSPNGFHYGCKFVNISEKDADEVHRWVFTRQIAQRRKQSF